MKGWPVIGSTGFLSVVPIPVKSPVRCGGAGNQRLHGRRFAAVAESLVGAENEQLVLDDRAAGGDAELILLQSGNSRLEEVAGVEAVVAQKLPRRSVELVGAGFGHHGDLRAGVAPVLGREVVRQHAHFLHRVGRRVVHAGVARRIVEVPAVEGEQVHVGAAAVDVHFRSAARVVHLLRRLDVQHARQNARQADHVAAVERQVDHPAVVDQSRQRRRGRIDQRRLGRHGHLRFHRADGQSRVDAQVLVHRQLDARLGLPLEARRFEAHFIGTRRHRRKSVETLRVGLRGAAELLFNHLGGHCDVRNGRSTGIFGVTADVSGGQLGRGLGREAQAK